MAQQKKYEEEIKKRWSGVEPEEGENKGMRFDQAQQVIDKLSKSAKGFFGNLNEEKHETQKMAQTFFKLLADKLNLSERSDPPTSKEVKEAISQLKDVGRFSFFASFSILPGGGAFLIALELLARRYGIEWFTFVPSSFRRKH